jgi:hypothetical protein
LGTQGECWTVVWVMETVESSASTLTAVVVASDATYEEYAGEPESKATAAKEVEAHDARLATATGTERPHFGAGYAF